MTPYELARTLHRELAPVAPRLAAALNRALVDIGGDGLIVGLAQGRAAASPTSLQEQERIDLAGRDSAAVLAHIRQALQLLDNHSAWQVVVDAKPSAGQLELRYTLFRL